MKNNIKVLLKRAKALFLAYVLVLGSFISVAPFLFAQKVGAEVSSTESLELKASILGEPIMVDTEDKSIEVEAGDVVRFNVDFPHTEEGGIVDKIIYNDDSYIEAKVGHYSAFEYPELAETDDIWEYLEAYNEAEESYKKAHFGKIIVDGVDGCGSDIDWSLIKDDEANSARFMIPKNSKAQATFCYFNNTASKYKFKINFSSNLAYSYGESIKPETLLGLIINPRKITVDLGEIEKYYGDVDPESVCKVVKGDLIYGDTKLKSCFYQRVDEQYGENVGTYAITKSEQSGVLDTNYGITFNDGSLKILPRIVTVVADSLTKKSGEDDPILTYKISGLRDGDVLGGAVSRVAGESAISYEIGIGTLASSNPNYYIIFTPGIFTIAEAPVKEPVQDAPSPYVAVASPVYYDRVGVVDTGEQESAGTVETKEGIKAKKEEVKKTWKILGAAWYWWILITAVLGALSWWFSPVKPAKDGKDTTNSSDK